MSGLGKCNCGQDGVVEYPLLPGSPVYCGKHDPHPGSCMPDDFDIPDDVFSPNDELPWEPPRWFWQRKPRIDAAHYREFFTWTTKDGRTYLLKDLTDQHLANIIPYIERVKMAHAAPSDIKRLKTVKSLMVSEQKYRKRHHIIVPVLKAKINFVNR